MHAPALTRRSSLRKTHPPIPTHAPANPSTQLGSSSASGKGGTPYENYNKLCYKWQTKAKKVFADALSSNEYVLVRNALRVLSRMVKVRAAAEVALGGWVGWVSGGRLEGIHGRFFFHSRPAPPHSHQVFPIIDQHFMALSKAVQPLDSDSQREVSRLWCAERSYRTV